MDNFVAFLLICGGLFVLLMVGSMVYSLIMQRKAVTGQGTAINRSQYALQMQEHAIAMQEQAIADSKRRVEYSIQLQEQSLESSKQLVEKLEKLVALQEDHNRLLRSLAPSSADE